MTTAIAKHPSIALALGGGGARGLAHILMLEALDALPPNMVAYVRRGIEAFLRGERYVEFGWN